jgi:DNA-binding MarR family transcriptional regulator
MKKDIKELRDALLDLEGVINRPQPDAAAIGVAGVDLDRALYPLLVRIARRGRLGIVELSELNGRNYTTISRQVSKLEALGLVVRCENPHDNRVRAVEASERGREMTRRLDDARQKIAEKLLNHWDPDDVHTLSRLMRRAADDAMEWVKSLK